MITPGVTEFREDYRGGNMSRPGSTIPNGNSKTGNSKNRNRILCSEFGRFFSRTYFFRSSKVAKSSYNC